MCDVCGGNPSDRVVDHTIDHPFELKPDSDNECQICDKHISAHPDKLEYLKKREMEDIIRTGPLGTPGRAAGHQVRYIFPPEGDDSAPFAYSVGRTVHDRPEILITGPLPPQVATWIVNEAARLEGEGNLPLGDMPADTLLEGYPVRIVEVRDLEEAQMFGCFQFGTEPTALQVVWPDKDGRFPGESGFTINEPVYATT